MPFFLLAAGIVFITALGAGIFVWTLAAVAVLWSGVYLFYAYRAAQQAPVSPTCHKRLSGPLPPCLAIVFFLVATLVPLPLHLSAPANSQRRSQNSQVLEMIAEARKVAPDAVSATSWFALTRNRAGTMRMLLLIVAALAAAALASALSPRLAHGYLRFLIILGATVAFLGYLGKWRIPQGNTLWWYIPIPRVLPGPMGGFINRNHFAGFIAMLGPVALALCAEDARRRFWLGVLLSAVCFGIMAFGVLASLSRGGFVAMLAGVSVASLVYAGQRRFFAALGVTSLAAVIIAAVILKFSPEVRQRLGTLREIQKTDSFKKRTQIWHDTLKIWRAYPLVGAGANAFRAVYPQFRSTSAREFSINASNEYIQLAAEGGLIGCLLAVWTAAALIITACRHSTLDTYSRRLLNLATAGALAAAAAHAFMDFALRVPLYALVLASLIGLRLGSGSPLPGFLLPHPRAAGVCLGLALALMPAWRDLRAMDSPDELRKADLRTLSHALVWTPTFWPAWYNFGRRLALEVGAPAQTLAAHCATRAALYDPNNYRLWLALGHFRLAIGDYRGAREAFQKVRKLRSWVEIPDVPDD